MAGLPINTQREMEKLAIAELKKRADQRLIPFLKANLRRDSGQMAENTEAQVMEENGKKKLRIVIGRGLNHPQFVETKYGILKDGTKAGAEADTWMKSLLD